VDAHKTLEDQKAKEAAEFIQELRDNMEMAAQQVLREAAWKELKAYERKMFEQYKEQRVIRKERLWDKRWNKYCNYFKNVRRADAQDRREEEARVALEQAATAAKEALAARRIKIEKIVTRELARRRAARKIQEAYRRFARRKAARRMKERTVSRKLREVFAKYLNLGVIQRLGEWCSDFNVSHLMLALNLTQWRFACSYKVPNEELNRCIVNVVFDNGLVRGFGSATHRKKLQRERRRAALEKQNALKVTVQNPPSHSSEEDDPEKEDELMRAAENEGQEPAQGDVTLGAQIPDAEGDADSLHEERVLAMAARSKMRRSAKVGRAPG
jgi:hypothetical protein